MSRVDAPVEKGRIRVLLADDSALMRHLLRDMLEEESGIEVIDEARDGVEAVTKTVALKPDVLVLDVEMPRLNGIAALKEIMRQYPLPTVMFSSLTKKGAASSLQALSLGAVDFMAKPSSREGMVDAGPELRKKIRTAAEARVRRIRKRNAQVALEKPKHVTEPASGRRIHSVTVIGSSTGGPQALEEVIPKLPVDFPGAIVVCQHMPQGFTSFLARRLDLLSKVGVKEAQNRTVLSPGQVLIAPGGSHLRLEPTSDGITEVRLDDGPALHGVKPSVDVTLMDAARIFAKDLLVVILTGMGFDGARGTMISKRAGATVICQDQDTSVVWGMPKACVEMGVADKVLPIDRIAPEIDSFAKKAKERQ